MDLKRVPSCEASRNVLPGEPPDAYHELWQTWLHKYQPECEADLQLLSALVNSAWRTRRTAEALLDVERQLYREHLSPAHWPSSEIQRHAWFQRAHKEAEAAFQKNLKLVVFMKNDENKQADRAARSRREWAKEHPQQAAAMIKAEAELAIAAVLKDGGKGTKKGEPKAAAVVAPEPKTRAAKLFSGQGNTKKQKKIIRLEQWIEVRIVNGKTVTELYPSNQKLIERGKKMLPAPEYVYRRLNFPDGIPPEYDWVGIQNEEHRKLGGMGIQRMTVETWLDIIEEEAKREDGHILAVENLPRPEETGGCDCPVCTHNREMLEQESTGPEFES